MPSTVPPLQVIIHDGLNLFIHDGLNRDAACSGRGAARETAVRDSEVEFFHKVGMFDDFFAQQRDQINHDGRCACRRHFGNAA